jgi:hypothetical protein
MPDEPTELDDLGGPQPLTLRDRKSILLAASDALLAFAREQPEGSARSDRLLLLAGYVMGVAIVVNAPVGPVER